VGETRKIYTVDIHELAMEAIKKKSEKYGLGNVQPLLLSGQASTIPDHIADVVCAMGLIAECRSSTNTRLAAIAKCGFPEAQHNNVAIAICRRFALASGLEWAGGLALGMGGAVSGKRLKEQGGLVRNIIKSLDLTADALVGNEPVSGEAIRFMAKPLIPGWMYTTVGRLGWRRQAKGYGARKKLRDRPYEH